jgi:hypothetical protein
VGCKGAKSVKLIMENWHKYLSEEEERNSEGMSEEEVQSIVNRVYPQILKDRGIPIREGKPSKPSVELYTDIYARYSDTPGMEGEVSGEAKAEFVDKDNAIYVYHPNMENEEDVIRSLLHEFEHAHQDPKEYEKFREAGFDGLDNPYEKAARKAEETWKDYLVDWTGEPPQ